MNDDLKAYVDGELPPDAAERLRGRLAADPELRDEEAAFQRLSAELRRLPEPPTVGREATLAAIGRKRTFPVLSWSFALAGCAAVLVVASGLSRRDGGWRTVDYRPARAARPYAAVEASIPAVRRAAFIRYVHDLGGEVRRDGDGLRAFYPESSHDRVVRRFLLPDDLPWPADGLRIRLEP